MFVCAPFDDSASSPLAVGHSVQRRGPQWTTSRLGGYLLPINSEHPATICESAPSRRCEFMLQSASPTHLVQLRALSKWDPNGVRFDRELEARNSGVGERGEGRGDPESQRVCVRECVSWMCVQCRVLDSQLYEALLGVPPRCADPASSLRAVCLPCPSCLPPLTAASRATQRSETRE